MRRATIIGLVFCGTFAVLAATKPDYPATARHPVAQAYADQTFPDDYQWLENAGDPAVQAWVAEQNRLTHSILDAVPSRDAIAQRLTALYKGKRLNYFGVTEHGGKLFAFRAEPPREQPQFVVLEEEEQST